MFCERRGVPPIPPFVVLCLLVIAGCENGSNRTATGGKSAGQPPVKSNEQRGVNKEHTKASDVAATATEPNKSDEQPVRDQVFRPDDTRPRHNDSQLIENGIGVFESKHLKLYTDIESEIARPLCDLIDQAYAAMEIEFGPLSPNRAGTEFQMTGYLMRDLALFREFSLVPEEIYLEHGLHRGQEFWMRDQTSEYYRRHLLIHEATHCYMTIMPGTAAPVWYLEGMAEFIATHQRGGDGQATFGVMPESSVAFPGFGRIEFVRNDIAAGRAQSFSSVVGFTAVEFRTTNHYAWAWAMCAFLDKSPRYHDRFRRLIEFTHGNQFRSQFDQMFSVDKQELLTEWNLCMANLQYGYDFERAAIDFQPGLPLEKGQPTHGITVATDRGWQSSQVAVEAGQVYEVEATGRFTLAEQPKPWVSEPRGISIKYFDGRPLGALLGCVRMEEDPARNDRESMLDVILLGHRARFQSKYSGTLYLRVNDGWDSLSDNRGQVKVTIRAIEPD